LKGYKGARLKSQINQDRAVAIVPFQIGQGKPITYTTQSKPDYGEDSSSATVSSRLIAVFDGHADLGENISQYAVINLPQVLAKKLDRLNLK
jgi:hypothetical protein